MALHMYFHRFIPLKLPFSFLFASPVLLATQGDVALFCITPAWIYYV